MKLIVGLGNPGLQYKKTWHNAGFLAIDTFFDTHEEHFAKAKLQDAFHAEVSEGTLHNEKMILAKPQTYMNNSGTAVKALAHFYKVTPEDIIIVHDEIDLPLGTLRISHDASSGGHNGIKSIITELGYQNFIRVRIGIRQESITVPTETYVLQKINQPDTMEAIIEKTVLALDTIIEQGLRPAMNRFN